MKIGEIRSTYSVQLRDYNMKLYELGKERKDISEKAKYDFENADLYEEQLKAIDIDYNAVKEKYDEYHKYMDGVLEQWSAICNMESAKQEGEAIKESAEELGKIMQVVRRLMKGDTVPYQDEKKLMEYDPKIYQMAKSMQMMAQLQERKHKDHDSLWEDEEPKETPEDPAEVADNTEYYGGSGPEVVDVEQTIADAHSENE